MDDEIFLKHSNLIEKLSRQKEDESDADKIFLLNAIRNILILALWLLIILKDRKNISYTMGRDTLAIPMDRIFAQRAFRRLLIVDAWHQFEYYFSKKIKTQNKNGKKLVEAYFKPMKEPDIIQFFRETRNALHGNGVYNKNKPEFKCLISGKEYVLSPGEEVEADWPFLFTIVEESLKIV